MKKCTKCLEVKPLEGFSRHSRGRNGLQSRCKHCFSAYGQSHRVEIAARKKEHYQSHKIEIFEYSIKRKYGLTPVEYQALIANGCWACGTMEDLYVDHDHKCCPGKRTCGKCVRGCLCDRHNRALGNVNDSVDELTALVAYLTRTQGARLDRY